MKFLINGAEHAGRVKWTVALAHGAGAAMDTPFMNRVAEGLAECGLHVVRFEFPYMQTRRADGRRRPPDPPRVLQATWHEVIDEIGPEHLIIGGKSMGGRIASIVADDAGVAGLVCLGYPFHPPGRPEKTRIAHLEHLKTPTLILQGTRDPFGTQEDVAGYPLAKSIQLHWLEDGDHSFKPRVRSGRTLEQNIDEAIASAHTFTGALSR
jgi:predicted alpha/beta-hydrolase family hydrolase